MEVLCSVLMLGGFFLLLGGVFAWAAYFEPKWDGERWARAAAQLGLRLTPGPTPGISFYGGPTIYHPMVGERGGLPVRVGTRVVVRGHGKNRRRDYYTYAEATLPRSLGLGLSLKRSNLISSALGEMFGAGDLKVGHPQLDSAYDIGATAKPEAVELLCMPAVFDPLRQLAGSAYAPTLSDTAARLEISGKCSDPAQLARILDQAVELAHRIVDARGALGPSQVQRVMQQVWRPVAEARGLTFDLDRHLISGRVEGIHVEVQGTLRGDGYGTAFVARFDRPLGLGLSLTKQGALTKLGVVLGMQDIEVGDPDFDGRFVVKGAPVDAVRAALTPDVRARLVHLQESATSLIVSDTEVRADVGWLVTEGAWVDLGLVGVARAAAALTGATRPGAGPFRRI